MLNAYRRRKTGILRKIYEWIKKKQDTDHTEKVADNREFLRNNFFLRKKDAYYIVEKA